VQFRQPSIRPIADPGRTVFLPFQRQYGSTIFNPQRDEICYQGSGINVARAKRCLLSGKNSRFWESKSGAVDDDDSDHTEQIEAEDVDDEEMDTECERERQLTEEFRHCARNAVLRWRGSEEDRADVEKYLIDIGVDQPEIEAAVWADTHRTIERIDASIAMKENRRMKAIFFIAERRRISSQTVGDLSRRLIENDNAGPPRLGN
jgi:hypothetical protein